VRRAAAAAVVVLAAAAALVALLRGDGLAEYVHREPPAFTVRYDDELLAPRDGALLTLAGRRKELEARLTVQALRLPAYEGDAAGVLPVHADNVARRLGLGTGRLTADRRARIHGAPGYEIGFETAAGTRTTLVLLLPRDAPPGARDGVLLRYDERQPPARDRGGGRKLALAARAALRSFQFGTERY
jgi:hypothetical protein